MMRRTAIILIIAVAACSTVPFREAERVAMDQAEPGALLERFRESLPERFEVLSSVVFEFSWSRIAALGITEVNREDGTFTAVAMNPMGVKLFELSGDSTCITPHYLFELFARQDGAAEAIGEDIRRIYFDLLPSPAAKVRRERYRMVFREKSGAGTLEYVFAGTGGMMVQKKYIENDETVWRASYYEYRRSGGKVHPMGIVFDNFRHGYRLIVKVKEITA